MADETLIGGGTGFQGCLPALTPIVDVIYKSRTRSLPLLLLFVLAPLSLSLSSGMPRFARSSPTASNTAKLLICYLSRTGLASRRTKPITRRDSLQLEFWALCFWGMLDETRISWEREDLELYGIDLETTQFVAENISDEG